MSSDRDEKSFNEYLSSMPWLALPFSDRARKAKLSQAFGVQGIPTLVVLDEDDKVITKGGRGAVDADPDGLEFPWRPKPFEKLNGNTVDLVNEGPALILCLASDDEAAAKLKAEGLLGAVSREAKKLQEAGKQDEMGFLFGLKGDALMGRVLDFAHVELATEQDGLIILNVPEQTVYRSVGQMV